MGLPSTEQRNEQGHPEESDRGHDHVALTLGMSNLNLVGTSLLDPASSSSFSCNGGIRGGEGGGGDREHKRVDDNLDTRQDRELMFLKFFANSRGSI